MTPALAILNNTFGYSGFRGAQAEIHSPLSGVIYTLTARSGAYLNAGDPIANVGQLERLRVRVYVDEPELGRIAIGQPPDRELTI